MPNANVEQHHFPRRRPIDIVGEAQWRDEKCGDEKKPAAKNGGLLRDEATFKS